MALDACNLIHQVMYYFNVCHFSSFLRRCSTCHDVYQINLHQVRLILYLSTLTGKIPRNSIKTGIITREGIFLFQIHELKETFNETYFLSKGLWARLLFSLVFRMIINCAGKQNVLVQFSLDVLTNSFLNIFFVLCQNKFIIKSHNLCIEGFQMTWFFQHNSYRIVLHSRNLEQV